MYVDINEISKRDLWSNNEGARWALFAIFVVIILVVIGGTLKVNKKRTSSGMQPIYGTRWMTPPSYNQSQNQYQQPRNGGADVPTNYVPTYTAEANEQDMGFYDNLGNFHANPNVKTGPFQFNNDNDAVTHPEQAHQRSYLNADGATINNDDLELTRPLYPPPTSSSTTLPPGSSDDSSITAPDHPPPQTRASEVEVDHAPPDHAPPR